MKKILFCSFANLILFRLGRKKKIKLESESINYRTFDPEKKRYACAYCGLKFPMRADRALHEKEIHIDETGKFLEISCDLCQEKLPSPVHFRRHAQDKHKKSNYTINNKESFCCDECGKTFKVKIFYPAMFSFRFRYA